MKGCNKILKNLKNLLIIISIILICSITYVHATDVEVGDSDSKTETTNLPYIEMKVKSKKVGESNQVLVEMWGSKFTNLEGIEIVFTYNNTKLIPSKVISNEAIENIDEIKYDKRPSNYNNPQTDIEKAEKNEFNSKSKETLSNSFAFNNNALGIDTFLYLEPNENIEAMQFIISRKDYLQDINAEEPILIGTFSFMKTSGTTIEESDFTTKRIKIYCDDGATEDDFSYYVREEANGENCTDIVEFTYEKYGSISGTIDTTITTIDGKTSYGSKNITNIELYESSKVADINFADKNYREFLPEPDKEYKTTEEENGVFKIENVDFGNYVVIIDKDNYADWIITNVDINSSNKDIDFSTIVKVGIEAQGLIKEDGIITLIPGDINKDGIINSNDTLAYNADKKNDKLIDFNDAVGRKGEVNDSNDTLAYNAAYTQYKSLGKKTVNVKTIINL